MNRDGTGPEGKGPLTGRGLGDCREEELPRYGRRCLRRFSRLWNR